MTFLIIVIAAMQKILHNQKYTPFHESECADSLCAVGYTVGFFYPDLTALFIVLH